MSHYHTAAELRVALAGLAERAEALTADVNAAATVVALARRHGVLVGEPARTVTAAAARHDATGYLTPEEIYASRRADIQRAMETR